MCSCAAVQHCVCASVLSLCVSMPVIVLECGIDKRPVITVMVDWGKETNTPNYLLWCTIPVCSRLVCSCNRCNIEGNVCVVMCVCACVILEQILADWFLWTDIDTQVYTWTQF